MANQFLGLSLFIMLLSFFIILNALSDFDVKKSSPVLNSLSLTFTNQKQDIKINPGKVQMEQSLKEKGSTLDKIQGLFQNQITGVETKQNRLGTTLRMRMPFKKFEREILRSLVQQPGGAPASGGADGFLVPTLVSLLDSTQENNVPYKMDIVISSSKEGDEIEQRLAKRISTITNKIEEAGLPKKLLTGGLNKNTTDAPKEDMVDLNFRRYQKFDLLASEVKTGTQSEAAP